MKLSISVKEYKSSVFEGSFDRLPLTIGRNTRSDISLAQYPWASRDHALIYREDHDVYILDLSSSNGIYFHGNRIEKMKLGGNTVFQIGSLSVSIKIEAVDSETEDMIETVNLSPEEFQKMRMHFEYDEKLAKKRERTPRRRLEENDLKDFDTSPMINFSDELTPVVTVNEEEAGFWDKTDPNLVLKPDAIQKHFSVFTPHLDSSSLSAPQRFLEIAVVEQGQVVRSKYYGDSENVLVDPKGNIGPKVSALEKAQWIARMQGGKAEIYVPANRQAYLVDHKGNLEKLPSHSDPGVKTAQYELVNLPIDRAIVLEFSETEAVGLRIARRYLDTSQRFLIPTRKFLIKPVSLRWSMMIASFALAFIAVWLMTPVQIGKDQWLPTTTRLPASNVTETFQILYQVETLPGKLSRAKRLEWEKEILPSKLSECFLNSPELTRQEKYQVSVALEFERERVKGHRISSPELLASTYRDCVVKKMELLPWARFDNTDVKIIRIAIESK